MLIEENTFESFSDSAEDENDSLIYEINLPYPNYSIHYVERMYRNNTNKMAADSKKVEDWTSADVIRWIMQLYKNAGESYERLNLHLLKHCTGIQLLKTTESELRDVDGVNSKWLNKKIKELARNNNKLLEVTRNQNFASFENVCNFNRKESSEDIRNSSRLGNVSTNEESDFDRPRRRGRPKLKNSRRRNSVPEYKTGKVWEFLRDMLHNPQYCPSLICWVKHDDGVFKFNASDEVAKIWGSMRGNSSMNYEKLSRAMRYYYKKKILEPVYGRRLVYKFGPKAMGWRTNNPNFQQE